MSERELEICGARKGIILAGGTGSRLFPMTQAVSKQLVPVYDKPMIYYPLSVLMLAGIRQILLITTPEQQGQFQNLLGDGSQWGVEISYAKQAEPEGLAQAFTIGEAFLDGSPACLALGDNILYGHHFRHSLLNANQRVEGAAIFGYRTNSAQDYGVVEMDGDGKVISIEEKPAKPRSDHAIPGIYFFDAKVCEYARTLKPSSRGELEIVDLINIYLDRGELSVEILGRGTVWLDTGTPDALAQATQLVQVIQQRQGLKMACPEEIAFGEGYIDRAQMDVLVEKYARTDYGEYLASL